MARTRRGRRASGARCATLVAVVALLGAVACSAEGDEADEVPETEETSETIEEEAEEAAGPVRGGTLRVGLNVDPVSIDPRFVVDDEGELIVDALFDPLVRIDADGEVVPAAARRWEVDDEGRTFTFHLREASFHDGSPVTAEDFKRAFDHIADATAEPPSFLAYLLADVVGIEEAQTEGGGIEGVIVEDERTLVIELDEPQPGFLITLADPSLVPLPPTAAEDPESFAVEPVGNGPFAMAGEREPESFIRLVRVEDHPREALVDEVLFTIYDADEGVEERWEALVEGQLHVARIEPDRREEASELFGRSRDGYEGPGLLDGIRSTVYLYGFDTSRPPFDDPRLRRAVSLSIDREALAEEVTEGARIPADSLVPEPISGARPGACDACVHDPEQAQDLLAEVVADLIAEASEDEEEDEGAEDEPTEEESDEEPLPDAAELIGPITLSYNRGGMHGAIAERLAEDIEDALGLEVDFQGQDLAPFVQGVRRGEVPMFRLGWDVTEPTGMAYLYPLFHSSQIGRDNLTRFADDDLDELLDTARASDDAEERTALLQDAEELLLAELPALPVLWYRHDVVIRPEIQDLRYSALGRLSLTEVWIDPEEANP